MNIATQGGKIITKDGKLGTDCACCGGWYCYDGAAAGVCWCVCEDPLKALPNVLLFNCVAPSWSAPPQLPGWPDPSTGGNISLARQITNIPCEPLWSGSYVSDGKTIGVTVRGKNVLEDTQSYGEGLNLDWQGPYTANNGIVYMQSYANTFLTPSGAFSAAAGKSAFRALCDGVSMSSYMAAATYTATILRGD